MENVQHQRIIDCHCHVYPDKIAAKAVKGIGDFYGLHMDMAGTVSDMKNAERDAKVSDCIIFSVATKQSQVRSINEFIASEVAKDPVHLTGLGTLHPDSDDIDGDIEQIINLGLKGVKLHPDVQQFKIDDYRCLKIYEKCEGRLPILMHTGDKRYDFSNPNRLKPILEIFTDLPLSARTSAAGRSGKRLPVSFAASAIFTLTARRRCTRLTKPRRPESSGNTARACSVRYRLSDVGTESRACAV